MKLHHTRDQIASSPRTLVVMLAALVATVAAFSVIVAPADASTFRNVYGSPGKVATQQLAAFQATNGLAYLDFAPIDVYRSAGYSGTQVITVQYRIWTWITGTNGHWYQSTQASATGTASPGYRVPFTSWTPQVPWNYWYSGDYLITWKTLSGSIVAQETLDLNAVSDYVCWSPYPRCSVGYVGNSGAVFLSSPW